MSANFAAALAAAEVTPKKSAKKSSMPIMEHDDHLAELADTYQEAKINMKQAEAVMAQAAEEIMEAVRERQDKDGYAGKFSNSYKVMGTRHNVSVVYQNRYSINPEDKGELLEILGDEYGHLIVEKPTVRLKAEVLEDEKLQAQLMKMVGDKFAQFFEVVPALAVAEGFSRDVYRAVAPEKLAVLRLYAKQYKPSLR
jgi:hypothetical protein